MFSSPQVAMFAVNTSAIAYLPSLFAEDLGLGLATVGLIFTLARIWDFATDPAFGYLSDHVSTPWGRRRIWLVVALPIALASFWLLYWPDANASATSLLVGLLLFLTALTIVQTSHFAWGSELTYDYHEKTRIMSWMQAGIVTGSLIVLFVPVVLGMFDSDPAGPTRLEAVHWMGWLLVVVTPLTFTLCLMSFKERPAKVHGKKSGFSETLLYMLRNDPLRRLFVIDILMGFGAGLVQLLTLFFVVHVLGNAQASSLAVFSLVLASFVTLPAWNGVSRRIGKHRTLMTANTMFVVIALTQLLFLRSSDPLVIAISWALLGMNSAIVFSLARAIMSDVVDKHSVEAGGIERTGLFFSCLTLSTKIGFGLSVGLGFFLLDLIGFVPGESNPEPVLDMFRYVFYVVPAIFYGLSVVVMYGFPLDEKTHRGLQERLQSSGVHGEP